MRLRFTKMHGLGNDFVVLDSVSQKLSITPDKIRKLADRNFGVGCDQVLIVEPPTTSQADFRYRIFNKDGGEVENCGNGARCFALFVRQRGLTYKRKIHVETDGGDMTLLVHQDDTVTVNMGVPHLTPRDIPFNREAREALYSLPLSNGEIKIGAVSVGNPHAVTLVENVAQYPVGTVGPEVESHVDFPNKVNAGFLEVISESEARLRVYERGVGETIACGTGACAAMVAGRVNQLLGPKVTIHLPGGDLTIEWEGEGKPVMMTGPATFVFHGQVKI